MHIFYYYWVKKIIRYTDVPLYNCSLKFVEKTNYKVEICEFFATIESNEALNVKDAVSRLIYGVSQHASFSCSFKQYLIVIVQRYKKINN